MKKLLLGLTSFALIGMMTSCDDVAIVPLDDVIRFDFSITADSTQIILSDTAWNIYEEPELADYQDDIESLKDWNITKVDGRLFNFRQDHPDNIINGRMKFRTDLGDEFEATMYEVGNEYKDGERHEIFELIFNGTDPGPSGRDYDAMSEAMIGAEILYFDWVGGQVLPGPLECDASIYVEYEVKAPTKGGGEK